MILIYNILSRRKDLHIPDTGICLQSGARLGITAGSAHVLLIMFIAFFALCRVEANPFSPHLTPTGYGNPCVNAGDVTLCSRAPVILAGFGPLISKTDTDELFAFTEIHTHEPRQSKRPSMCSHIKVGLIATGLWSSFAFIMLMLRKKRDHVDVVPTESVSIEALLSLPDPALQWKHDNGYFQLEAYNQAASDLCDGDCAELTGIYAQDYFVPFENAIEGMKSTFFSGKAARREIKLRQHEMSEEKLIECDYVKIDDKHILTILRTITNHHCTESNLSTSTAMLRHLSGNLPVVIFHIDFHPKLQFHYVSDYVTKLTGYTTDDFYANPQLALTALHIDDSRDIHEIKQGHFDFITPDVFRWTHRDGRTICIEVYNAPIISASGEVTGIQGFANDITERTESRQKLDFYKKTIDGVSELITIIDSSYCHVFANETYVRYHAKSRDEIIGTKLDELLSGPGKWDIIDKITRSLNGEQLTYETTFIYPVIGERNLEISHTPLHENGEIKAVIAVIRDITDRRSAELALSDSETRYRALFEASLDAICMTDENGILTDANQAMTDLVGYELDELTGIQVSSLFHSHDDFNRTMVNVRKEGFIRNRDVLFTHKNGTTVECLITATTQYGITDDIIGYQAIIHDITELKKVQQALHESELKFRAIADYAHNLEIWFGTDGKIRWVNNVVEKMTGYNPDEITASDDILRRIVHIDHFNYINHIFHDALTNQTTGNEVPFLFVKKDGNTAWFATSWRPIYDHNDEYIGIRMSLRDITDSKKTEDNLAESEKRFRHVVEAVPFPVIIFDRKGNTKYINPIFSQTLGYTINEIVSHARWLTVAFPSDVEINNSRSRWKEATEGIRGKPIDYANIKVRRSDGELRTLYSTYIPIDEENLMFVGEDITRRVIAEEELRQSLREKDVLLREVHHRVKNNMQVISSLLMLQGERIRETEYFSVFQESINRIHSMALIHEMLYQTRNFSRINVHDYFMNISSNIRSMYMQVAPAVEINIDIQDLTLEIDFAIPCGLIVNELISNALKYAFGESGTGTINISMKETEPDSFVLTVTDDGAGIPDDYDWRETSSLGLRIVRLLSERQLHGSIEKLESEGTGFVISFEKFETQGNNDVSEYDRS